MTITELQIQLDLNLDNRIAILKNVDTCRYIDIGYLFVDSEDGQCYLFDRNGYLNDISKVKRIDNWTFECCTSLTSIEIPNSVKSIGEFAFYSCTSLTNIKIPDSIKWIENNAFDRCASLTSIKIPDSVKSIGFNAFYYCSSLKEVVVKGKTMKQINAMTGYPWGLKLKNEQSLEF